MDTRSEVREFLTTRRARISPEQAGLPTFGGKRRVAGLRREEVAMLAGMSVDYYTRLERGDLRGASDEVLHALALALDLDDAERSHLFDLARAGRPATQRRRSSTQSIRPSLQRVVDALQLAPAYVRNGRLDVLATNSLGRAVFREIMEQPGTPNIAKYQFLDPRARTFFIDYDKTAGDCVALLRAEAGRNPYDKSLTDLIGELSTRSDDFRVRWAAHNVRRHSAGEKHFLHPTIGQLDLQYEALELTGEADLQLMVYTAAPGSPTHDALQLLGSLQATTR